MKVVLITLQFFAEGEQQTKNDSDDSNEHGGQPVEQEAPADPGKYYDI